MEKEIKISLTLRQLECLLDEQKKKVIERLQGHTYIYNNDSTDGQVRTLNIDKEKMRDVGMKASYPDDLNVLKRYLP